MWELDGMLAGELPDFNAAVKAGAFDVVEITEAQFRAACMDTPASYQFIAEWFEALKLSLLPRQPRCIDILCS